MHMLDWWTVMHTHQEKNGKMLFFLSHLSLWYLFPRSSYSLGRLQQLDSQLCLCFLFQIYWLLLQFFSSSSVCAFSQSWCWWLLVQRSPGEGLYWRQRWCCGSIYGKRTHQECQTERFQSPEPLSSSPHTYRSRMKGGAGWGQTWSWLWWEGQELWVWINTGKSNNSREVKWDFLGFQH